MSHRRLKTGPIRFADYLMKVRWKNQQHFPILIDKAAIQAKLSGRATGARLFSLPELNWFSRNSYNLALKVCTKWDPSQTLTLIQACLKVLI